jgi:peptide/nickel transport system substrate-binding protein
LQGYDPAEANAILDAAGYTRGAGGVRVDPKTGKPLDLRLGIHGDSPDDAATANYLVGWLGAIGIKLSIDSLSMGNVAITSEKGTWDLLMDGWTGAPDPTGLLSIQTCGSLPADGSPSATTDAFYCNSDFDKLFAEQSTVFDAAQRVKVVDQMQQMIYNADDNIVLYYQTVDIAYSDKVAGLITGKPDARGYYPAQTTFYSYLQAAPAAASGESSGSDAGLWVGLAAVVVLLGAAGFFLIRRRARADDME